jgi:hypothetical protein
MFYRKSIDSKEYKCYLLDLPKSHKPEKTSGPQWPLLQRVRHYVFSFLMKR